MGTLVVKQITMTLDPDSIQHALDEVRSLNDDLKDALDSLCKKLLKDGVLIAKIFLGELVDHGPNGGLRSNDLRRSIRVEMEDGRICKGYIVAGYPGDHESDNPRWANTSYAVFVEFGYGTGSYHLANGSLIKNSRQLHHYNEMGKIASKSGRTRRHKAANEGTYRSMESYGTVKDSTGKEFFGWIYKDQSTGKFYVSHGQNPKPFMYKTLQKLTMQFEAEGANYVATYIAGKGSGAG